MSIAKMPFTIAALVGLHVTYTTPNPASEGEGKLAGGEYRLPYFFPLIRKVRNNLASSTSNVSAKSLPQYFFATLAVVEIVTIIANFTKELPISQRVVALLMASSDPDRIRITPLSMLGALLVACGGWARNKCYRELGKQFTFEVSIREDHKLVTTGPYAIVRHPSYTAMYLVEIGIVCFHASRGSWLRESGVLDKNMGRILVYGIIAVLVMPVLFLKVRWDKEDKMLKKEFGKRWDEWAQRVPYAVLPGIL
jgi:protein-S-isoprenylcysteine O-methyltransferase Ste14